MLALVLAPTSLVILQLNLESRTRPLPAVFAAPLACVREPIVRTLAVPDIVCPPRKPRKPLHPSYSSSLA
jgi:hypothetical protein